MESKLKFVSVKDGVAHLTYTFRVDTPVEHIDINFTMTSESDPNEPDHTDYEADLLAYLFEHDATLHGCVERSKEFLTKQYENHHTPINAEAIDLFVTAEGSGYALRYHNLYTFMLIRGVSIPYCNWVYHEQCITKKYTYSYNKKNGKCSRISNVHKEIYEKQKEELKRPIPPPSEIRNY